jgi:hypothetical protein
MKLFKPKRPAPVPVETLRFHFEGDSRLPPKSLPPLADALAAIEQEKGRLRSAVDAGKGLPAIAILKKSIADVAEKQKAAHADYNNAFARQHLPDAERARSTLLRYSAEQRRQQIELQKVEAAEVARNALAGLLAELAR